MKVFANLIWLTRVVIGIANLVALVAEALLHLYVELASIYQMDFALASGFLELSAYREMHALASSVYRQMSEFVHGNVQTLLSQPELIKFDGELHSLYLGMFEHVIRVVNFALALRYLSRTGCGSMQRSGGRSP